jgi:hypothetical protein
MHWWVWCCIYGLHHVCWCLCIDDGFSEHYGSCVLWNVIFGWSQLWEVWHSEVTGGCIKTDSLKLKAELLLSPTDAMQCCTFWGWPCGLLYMLAVIPCALISAGHDAVCSCTCWQWWCTLVYAGHDTVCSCTCWAWPCGILYMLAVIVCS